jgi:hypothetical protein
MHYHEILQALPTCNYNLVNVTVLHNPRTQREKSEALNMDHEQKSKKTVIDEISMEHVEKQSIAILNKIVEMTKGYSMCTTPIVGGHIKFFGREEVIATIGFLHIQNLYYLQSGFNSSTVSSTRSTRTAVFIDQMHGSGKTTVICRLFETLHAHKELLFKKIKNADMLDFTHKIFDTWLGARSIVITRDSEQSVSPTSLLQQIASEFHVETNQKWKDTMRSIGNKCKAILLHIDQVPDTMEKMKELWTSCITLEEEATRHDILFQYIITGWNTQMTQVRYMYNFNKFRSQNSTLVFMLRM